MKSKKQEEMMDMVMEMVDTEMDKCTNVHTNHDMSGKNIFISISVDIYRW